MEGVKQMMKRKNLDYACDAADVYCYHRVRYVGLMALWLTESCCYVTMSGFQEATKRQKRQDEIEYRNLQVISTIRISFLKPLRNLAALHTENCLFF